MSAPLAALILLATLAGPPAGEGPRPPGQRDARSKAADQRKAPPRDATASKEKLSEEDAALIRDLALLEKVELLQHLELFEAQQKETQTAGQQR